MYPIRVCLRSLVFRRVLERYTHVYMAIPEMCISRYTHCRALQPSAFTAVRELHTGKKHFADEGSLSDDILTDSSKDVPTIRGVVSAVAD